MSSGQNSRVVAMHQWKWSGTEKAVARKAFDAALSPELEAAVREAKNRVARVHEASELWKLERWLAERRRHIESTFDYRYSVLPIVFGNLLREGRRVEEELDGLAPEKLDVIRGIARL